MEKHYYLYYNHKKPVRDSLNFHRLLVKPCRNFIKRKKVKALVSIENIDGALVLSVKAYSFSDMALVTSSVQFEAQKNNIKFLHTKTVEK